MEGNNLYKVKKQQRLFNATRNWSGKHPERGEGTVFSRLEIPVIVKILLRGGKELLSLVGTFLREAASWRQWAPFLLPLSSYQPETALAKNLPSGGWKPSRGKDCHFR